MSGHRAPNDDLVVCPSESTDTPENNTLFHVDETESTATSHRNVRQTEKNSDPTHTDSLAPEDVNKSQDSSVWRRAWITPASIVGFYTAALMCAVAHFCVFNYLDGRIADRGDEPPPFRSTSIPQSYVTTISLVLVTAFRASLVASIGICYTQYLWQTLRRQLLEAGLIEELFQIRANALRLFNPALVRYTPSLLVIATLTWLVPLATVYPPGALTVGLEVREIQEQFNVSVIPASGKLQRTGRIPRPPDGENDYLVSFGADDFPSLGWLAKGLCGSDEGRNETCFSLLTPSFNLDVVAKSALATRKILDFRNPAEANASYEIKFPGPRLQCQETEGLNITSREINTENPEALFESSSDWVMKIWPEDLSITLEDLRGDQISMRPCPHDFPGQAYEAQVFRPYTRSECKAATAEYTVSVSFLNGRQGVHYVVGELLPLKRLPPWETSYGDNQTRATAIAPLKSWEEYVNVVSLIESLQFNLEVQGTLIPGPYHKGGNSSEFQPLRLSNGSEIQVCTLGDSRKYSEGGPMFNISAFNTNRFLEQDPSAKNFFVMSEFEALLNEALANITISALSLGLWDDVVNGTGTRLYNIYRFHRQLNFFLPYGLCLLFTLPVVAIGLVSLRNNGVSSIDGGFLQILMTAATGRTELETAASKGHLGGYENIPNELRKLKVRFGVLVTSENPTEYASMMNTRRRTSSVEEYTEAHDSGEDISLIHLSRQHRSRDIREENSNRAEMNSAVQRSDLENLPIRRAGFGVLKETRPLRRADG